MIYVHPFKQTVDGYTEWVESLIENGWTAYIITFMFKAITGSRTNVMGHMKSELERSYACLLTRTIRCPHSEKNRFLKPIWILCPDFPVHKNAKKSLREVSLNNGLHYQGIALLPPTTRFATNNLALELEEHWKRYAGPSVSKLHASRITETPEKVVDYVLKSIPQGRASFDDVIIFPRSRNEVSAHWDR